MVRIAKPSPERSKQMSLVKAKGNKSTELRLAKLLRKKKIWGWRRHPPLPGHPDFAFGKEKVALFVDGCFWHGCERCYRRPKSNVAFWARKVRENIDRDHRVNRELRGRGWNVLRIWEHSFRHPSAIEARIRRAVGRRLPRYDTGRS